MAAKQPAVGIDHLTVVPSNFERPDAAESDDDADDAETDANADADED